MNINENKQYLEGEREIEQLSREWLRTDTPLTHVQGNIALKKAKHQLHGLTVRWVKHESLENTCKLVRCNIEDPGAFIYDEDVD